MWHHKCISSYSSFNFYKLFHPSSTEVVSPVFAWFTNETKSEKFQTFFLCVLLFESSVRIWMTTHTRFILLHLILTPNRLTITTFVRSLIRSFMIKNAKTCSHCFKSKCSIFNFCNAQKFYFAQRKTKLVCRTFFG